MMSEPGIRLNKYLASCGVGSRRGCDARIQNGEVIVNGEVCNNPAYRVQASDFVKIGNRRFEPKETTVIALHKPAGLVCTRHDEGGKNTIYDILPPRLHHLAHVGRLDKESEGLLILSNDGELAHALTRPARRIFKYYQVTLENSFENSILDQLVKGVYTEEGKMKAVRVKRLSPRRIEMVLDTGKKRQIRYMMKAVGHRVKRLLRTRIGQLELGQLRSGKWSVLSPEDVELLLEEEELDLKKNPQRKTP